MNTLNRKQYASQGGSFLLSFRYISGNERFALGSKSDFLKNNFQYHNWWKIKLRSENYYGRSKYKYGYLFEGVLSNQDNFLNLRSTQIAAPAFYPLNDSRSLFLDNFRAFSYLSAGIRNVYEVKRKVDFRLEGYGFLPFENISIANTYNFNFESLTAKNISFAGTFGLVYHSFIGPISTSLNYYDKTNKHFGFLFHIGFLLYQSKSLD